MSLTPATRKIMLEGYRLPVDIGFHASEIGDPQMLELTVEVWLDSAAWAAADEVHLAWDYDFLRHAIAALAAARRYNLQETFVGLVYDLVAAKPGVTAVRVSTRKPDVYPDARAVGVELASF